MSRRYSSLKAPMLKFGTRMAASLRVMSSSIMSLLMVTGVADVGISRPFPSSLNLAIGILGGFGSSVLVVLGKGLVFVNET